MGKRIEIPVGTRFGKLVVLGAGEPVRQGKQPLARTLRCQCDCGSSPKDIQVRALRNLGWTSCGCAKREALIKRGHAGGMYGHPLRKIWAGIVARCENPNATGYEYWGGRGISLYGPWRDLPVFIAGVEAEIGPRPDESMTLDRVRVNGNYEPGNIRWLPRWEQPFNRREMFNETEVAELLAQHHCLGCQCQR